MQAEAQMCDAGFIRSLLDKIMALSYEMLDCSNNEHWDELVEIELKRCPMLVELAQICTSQEGVESIGVGYFNELLAIENKVQFSCENEKKQCQKKITQLSKGKVAANAYSSFS